jgi:hypothetical protein
VLGLARHADYAMVWLNSIFLMGQSFIPFPTALMGEYSDNPLAVSFFGGVFAVNTLLFIALNAYIARNLIKPELAPLLDPHGVRKGMIGPPPILPAPPRLVQRARRLRDLCADAAVLHHAAAIHGPSADAPRRHAE